MSKFHFIGIGGIGMSALARILLDKKLLVSGSDISTSKNIEQLISQGAVIQKGHSAKHISPQHTVIYSSDIKESNPEFLAAKALNCPLLHRSELLAELMKGYRTLLCTGTHGKTTTTSLLTHVLFEGGFDPTFAVGGMIQGINGREGKGEFFVAEADESDGSFLNYESEGAIITNVEPEHLDHYKGIEALHAAFSSFFENVKKREFIFYWGDDPVLLHLAKGRGVSYGFSEKCALRLSSYAQAGWESQFDLTFEGKSYPKVRVALTGEHNALNAAAVFGLALRLGVSEERIRYALAHFPGVARRCQKRGEEGGVLRLDDYAHHPTEIEKTLKAVKMAVRERRLVVLFQPHRYTRTRELLKSYGKVFEWADQLYVMDIYAAREEPIEGISAELILEEIKNHSTVPCEKFSGNIPLFPHDVFLTMGAGDVSTWHEKIPAPKKCKLGLIFGGLSCEHEISLRSARFVANSLDQNLYEITYFGIDKKGEWITGNEAKEILENHSFVTSPNCKPLFAIGEEIASCDLFFPVLHGTFGEDGTLQGFFEMLGKPYVGPDYRSAAIAMDKVLTKWIVAAAGIPTPSDLTFGAYEWREKREEILTRVTHFPVYVKPIHLGSSVGITCVEKREELEEAIEKAFRYDTQIMIEEGKKGCRELEFAVVGNTHSFPVVAPAPGEKLAGGTFVDYTKKYSSTPVQMTPDAILTPELLEKGKSLAKSAYEAVGCSGMTRVDFLLDPEGNYWFFEMNPIPGMTALSLFPKIWNREGVPPPKLLDRLIILALERKRKQDRHFKCL